ncbi:inactive polyglycylase TTLL10 isoform X3 [Castor canadensis]|uniref:Inactive polyglycylase TTLL10 isoform X3 n=1 Tax=Castor canadensis TaxID=51338 RepID=A0AC58N7T5_CASCN
MASRPRATRPHGHHRDENQPQTEATARNTGKRISPGRVGLNMCPVKGLGLRAARRPGRGLGAASSPRGPRPGAPIPATCSCTRFIYYRGQPTRISSKRPRRSRIQRCHVRAPGWAHERQMGSSGEEGLQAQLSQLDQDAELTENVDADRPPVVLLEGLPLEGDKQSPSTGQGPFFYIGGTNGASIISSYCESKGWQRTQDNRREDYKLKWCEIKCKESYINFREGQQLLFQLPNNKLLTTKIGLLSALREHARIVNKSIKTPPGTQAKILKMDEFFPETYRLDIREERQVFFTLFDETQIWICKPTASNQGKGIFLIRTQEEAATLQAKTQSIEDDPLYRKTPFRVPQARVVQRYIQNPLLLEGKKFDVRSYLLVACAMPYMVFFGHGYARLTLSLYDPHSSDLSGHLTNQFMQKKSPLYVMLKEDTVWSMDRLNCYINDKFRKTKGLPRDWVFTTFTKRMQQIMAHCFLAVKSKLECKLGYFDLIGCDFLIDENFKVWLLEMNSNPALHTNCEVLKEVIPGVVMETLEPPAHTCWGVGTFVPSESPTHPAPPRRPGAGDLPEELAQPEDASSAVAAPLRAPAQRRRGPVAALGELPHLPPPAAGAQVCLRGRALHATRAARRRQAGRTQARASPGRAWKAAVLSTPSAAARPQLQQQPWQGTRGSGRRAAADGLQGLGTRAFPGAAGGGARGGTEALEPPRLLDRGHQQLVAPLRGRAFLGTYKGYFVTNAASAAGQVGPSLCPTRPHSTP